MRLFTPIYGWTKTKKHPWTFNCKIKKIRCRLVLILFTIWVIHYTKKK